MDIVFRVDASLAIGSGHVMRCLTLASALRESGTRAAFICREHEGHLCDVVASQGFAIARLPAASIPGSSVPAHAAWLGVDWETDARDSQAALRTLGTPRWLVVDHYAIDARWETRVRASGARILSIDDLADRAHDCDVLLDQNLFADAERRYLDKLPPRARKLLGPRFALLRSEFRAAARQRAGVVRRIFIFFGQVDPTNETEKTLRALELLGERGPAADVLVGRSNPHDHRLRGLVASLPGATLHRQITNVAEVMSASDHSVASGGTNTWERCCLGLPSLSIAVAENQRPLLEGASEAGLTRYLGWHESVDAEAIAAALLRAMENTAETAAMSTACLRAVDGRGTDRVIDAMRAAS